MAEKLTLKAYKNLVEEQGRAILDAIAFAATGDLEASIEIPEGIEVMTDLAIGFSYLIEDIKELLRQQQLYQTELEKRVAERTTELEQALKELQEVQGRYIRDQWQSYTNTAVEQPIDDMWQPILAEAIQSRKAIHHTTTDNGPIVALPITYADETIGVLGFNKDDSTVWQEEEIQAAQDIVEQLSLALENQRLFDQSQQRAAELAILNEMVGELTLLPDEMSILEAIYRYIARLMDASNFYVAMYNPERSEITFPFVMENNQRANWRSRAFGNGLSEYIIRTGQELFIADDVEKWLEQQQIKSVGMLAKTWMGVPLRLGTEVTGVIALQSDQAHFYSRDQFDLLGSVANQAIIAIQNARQFQHEQTRAQREQRLREVAAKVRSSVDVDTIMRTAVQEISQLLGRQAFVYLGPEHLLPGQQIEKDA